MSIKDAIGTSSKVPSSPGLVFSSSQVLSKSIKYRSQGKWYCISFDGLSLFDTERMEHPDKEAT